MTREITWLEWSIKIQELGAPRPDKVGRWLELYEDGIKPRRAVNTMRDELLKLPEELPSRVIGRRPAPLCQWCADELARVFDDGGFTDRFGYKGDCLFCSRLCGYYWAVANFRKVTDAR